MSAITKVRTHQELRRNRDRKLKQLLERDPTGWLALESWLDGIRIISCRRRQSHFVPTVLWQLQYLPGRKVVFHPNGDITNRNGKMLRQAA